MICCLTGRHVSFFGFRFAVTKAVKLKVQNFLLICSEVKDLSSMELKCSRGGGGAVTCLGLGKVRLSMDSAFISPI